MRKLIIFVLIELISFSSNSTLEECRNTLKEIAYSYYMRGKNIQYHLGKWGQFSPENATEHNQHFMVCATFITNVYRELLNITFTLDRKTIDYTRENVGKPEVIVYSYLNDKKEPVLLLYTPGEKNYKNITKNFSLKDIIPSLQVGDVLTYSGHTKLIYDLEKDSKGNIIDAFTLEVTNGIGWSYVKSKIALNEYTRGNAEYYPFLSKLNFNSKLNDEFEEGLIEGAVGLRRLSTRKEWLVINNTDRKYEEYSVLRIMQSDSKGNAVLKFKTIEPNSPNQFLYNDTLELSEKNLDRLKFKHLYIEKTVNKYHDNIVLLGDVLNYKLIIINHSKKDYEHDLIVKEHIPDFVEFQYHYENKSVASFNYDNKNKILIWNIGKLKKGEKITINFLVRVVNGKPGDKIKSYGFVNNIETSTIINTIGINLNKNQKNSIIKSYEKLKNKHTGKKLINEIYKNSFNIDLKFDSFDITNLIYDTKSYRVAQSTIGLYKNNTFYGALLNKYWSKLASSKHSYIPGTEEVNIFDIKYFGEYNDPERRADFIFKEHFQTGDILLYQNREDAGYSVDNDNHLVKTYYTNEEGEYAYIFIENKGFVGVNLGDDGIKNTKDDRNEFNAKYYKDNNFEVFQWGPAHCSDELLETAQYQTLYGKDCYVILRPSLSFKIQNIKNNHISIILLLISITVILGCGLYIIFKCLKMKKNGKEFNFTNLKQELLFSYKTNN